MSLDNVNPQVRERARKFLKQMPLKVARSANWPMGRPSKYSPELRERAVRMVFEHAEEHPSQWATIRSVGEKLGCSTAALQRWVRQAERDAGKRPGLTTDERAELRRGRISGISPTLQITRIALR